MSPEQTKWAPPTGSIIAAAVVGLALCVSAVTLVTDLPGRILVGLAGFGLVAFAQMSWQARPKLAIDGEALIYRGWWRERRIERADITLIRITEFRRLGRKVRLLEIDTEDGRLLVLSRWDLGTDPVKVLDALTDAGFAPGRR
ncbi:PH domain-containing protein [Mycolicibacterium vaccae]|uniref:PH domain-containing protein n=1 Tax=Mycolicibacterium vaccae TaxID=1810 RepID=UPI003CEB449E